MTKIKRQIIKIDEDKCTGCGLCIPSCPEGALQIVDTPKGPKARLIKENFCDGLGACLGNCPEGALNIIEAEVEVYDERKVAENILKEGPNAVKMHLEHLKEHNQTEYLKQAIDFLKEKNITIPVETETVLCEHNKAPYFSGCQGSMAVDFRKGKNEKESIQTLSELRQWPIQLHLLNPVAPYFKNADLLISADCAPFAFSDFHSKLLRNKILIILCPKLDQAIDKYITKLADIFKNQNIKSITVAHMEVPCCSGIENIVKKALELSRRDIPYNKVVVSIKGEIVSEKISVHNK